MSTRQIQSSFSAQADIRITASGIANIAAQYMRNWRLWTGPVSRFLTIKIGGAK